MASFLRNFLLSLFLMFTSTTIIHAQDFIDECFNDSIEDFIEEDFEYNFDDEDYDDEDECAGLFVNADVLFWSATEGGLSVASFREIKINNPAFIYNKLRSENLDYDWNTGFRVGMGYRPPCCGWDIHASWTYIETSGNKILHPSIDDIIVTPDWGSFVQLFDNFTEINSQWTGYINWADVEFRSAFCILPTFVFGVHSGIRGISVDQKFKMLVSDSSTDPSTTDSVVSTSTFRGMGIVAGVDAEWEMGCGFSVFASGGGALFYGPQNSNSYELFLVPVGESSKINKRDHYRDARAMSDLRLCLNWTYCSTFPEIAFTMQVGWEHHMLFSQNHFERGSLLPENSRARSGDLSLHGVTLSLMAEF